jgi:dTDP-4-amino-4,6-dideoxygalactose transaminase
MINPYKIVADFEQQVCEFTGSKYAVAVDSCTNAIFLCCKYLSVQQVTIPCRTYVSVPCSIIHAGGKVQFEDIAWSKGYQLKPYPIYDNACVLSRNMYISDTYQCLSFSANKPLRIGKGGMILTDDPEAVRWFKLARYEGRSEISILKDNFEMLGWNMYMTPEQASRGLVLMSYLKEENFTNPVYPDLSQYEIYTR